MGLCKQLHWPGEFQTLLSDRVAKGFSLVQIVAGLYPDMPAFDERRANEAGFPCIPMAPTAFGNSIARSTRWIWGLFVQTFAVDAPG